MEDANVGFRYTLYREAIKLKITGWVKTDLTETWKQNFKEKSDILFLINNIQKNHHLS